MDYASQQRNPGKHLPGIGFVVLLHVVLVWALVNGLARKVVEVVKGPLETKIIQEIKPPPPEAPPPPEPVKDVVRTAPVVKAGGCREPEYPAASARLGESGRVVLSLLVDVDGKVADSKIEHSSGSPRLDEAARAALSLCKFTPGTVDGQPEQAWGRIAYVFKDPNR